ncbi:serine/threonine-protein kinase M1, partial [Coemansia sp. Benny D160-2]
MVQHPKLIASWKKPFYLGADTNNTSLKSSSNSRSSERGSSAYADAVLVGNMVSTLRSACNVGGRLGAMAAASCAACLAYIGGLNARAIEKSRNNDDDDDNELSSLAIANSTALGLPVFPTLYRLDTDEERVEFVCTLIVDFLSQAFARAPSPSVQACAAYGIQELLKLVGFTRATLYGPPDDKSAAQNINTAHNRRKRRDTSSRRPRDGRSQSLQQRWDLLPENIVQVILPLLDSKYSIQSTGRSASAIKTARVPCITRATCHLSWLRAWVVEMANALPPDATGSIFKACTSIMKESSVDMLLFFLPQTAYHYCIHMKSVSGDLTAEIETIEIKDDDTDIGKEDTRSTTGEANSSKSLNVLTDELKAVLSLDAKSVRMPADQWRLCKEATLDLLDSFSAYLRAQQHNRVSGKRSSRKDSKLTHATDEELAILSITNTVPHSVVASAAASCHQYERALQHLELSLREDTNSFGKHPTLFGNIDDATMATIQELYFGMDDADGVVGAASCRKQVDHRMLIRKYEVEGN